MIGAKKAPATAIAKAVAPVSKTAKIFARIDPVDAFNQPGFRAVRIGEHIYKTPVALGFYFMLEVTENIKVTYRKLFPNKGFSAKKYTAWLTENVDTIHVQMSIMDIMLVPVSPNVTPRLSLYFVRYMPTEAEMEIIREIGSFFLQNAGPSLSVQPKSTSGSNDTKRFRAARR